MSDSNSKVFIDHNNCRVLPAKGGCQYRATQIWNEVVRSFRTHICCKKHRRLMRTYNDCFTATAAIDVLFAILKANKQFFGEVTRIQALKLMRKFLKKHIIEDVNGKWGTEDFSDGGRLYRFPSDDRTKEHSLPSSKRRFTLTTSDIARINLQKKHIMPERKSSSRLPELSNEQPDRKRRMTISATEKPKCAATTKSSNSCQDKRLPIIRDVTSRIPQSIPSEQSEPRRRMTISSVESSRLQALARSSTSNIRLLASNTDRKTARRHYPIRTPPKAKRYSVQQVAEIIPKKKICTDGIYITLV
ncbi:uncharacterized protein LOC120330632 [Styela clava]|uniref:DEP domain-containing protein 1A-like n=1 Tax=Styela clava TaxID=7725 RepID=UPI00193A929C|nr:DEP domain-containing protein 1A-like [Styela clava]